MYKGKNNELYGDLEETILACLLIEPSLINKLKVEEKHFNKFGYVLTFFKSFYNKYKNLDVSLMLSIVKGTTEMELLDVITYLTEIFVIPNHFEEYQKRLLERYNTNQKDKWLSEKIYEKATQLKVGTLTLQDFYKELKKINDFANKKDWR